MENRVLKTKETPITEDLLKSLIGKLINVPVNEHEATKPLTKEKEKINVWFAGTVAGYEKQVVSYDFTTDSFHEPIIMYAILLTDGHAYMLSHENCIIEEITEEKFLEMVEEYERKQLAKESIMVPGKDF